MALFPSAYELRGVGLDGVPVVVLVTTRILWCVRCGFQVVHIDMSVPFSSLAQVYYDWGYYTADLQWVRESRSEFGIERLVSI